VNPFIIWRSYYTAGASGSPTATPECSLLFARRQPTAFKATNRF